MKPLFLLTIGFLYTVQIRAQSFASQADSLRNLLKVSEPDTNRVNLLLKLGHSYIFKLSELAPDLDTALLLSRQAYALSRSIGYPKGQGLSYLTAAQAYREKKEFEKGKQCTQRAIDLLKKYGSLENQADAYIEQATYYTVSEEGLNQAIRLNERVVSLLRRAGNKQKLAEELVHQGDLYQLQSNNTQALKALQQALKLYQSIGYPNLQYVYDRLGFVSGKIGNYEAGIRYVLLAMKTAEEVKDSLLLGEVYNRIGVTYKELNQPEKAVFYFNKALLIAGRQHFKSTIILVANTVSDIAEIYSRTDKSLGAEEMEILKNALIHLQTLIKNRPADKDDIDCRMAVASCYVGFYGRLQQDYAKAQPYCDQLEELLGTSLGEDYKLYIHGILIPFYISSHQPQKAYQHLAENEEICEKESYIKQLSINHLWWFKLDSAQARYPSAITHYQRYKALNDSLLSEITTQKVAQLEVQYKTQEKERNILQLRRQSKSQQGELQKAETTKNLSIVSAIMLVLLLGLSYNRYRLKQRSNQLLEAKQLEINHKNHSLLESNQLLEAKQVEINQKNQSLQQVLTEKDGLLAEKEWMLKEIHHRVKNNLQIITSLLHSQGVYLKDQAAVSAIRESQNRVHAMALIHQKLYQSDRLSGIPMNEYIAEIVDYLITSFARQDTVKPHFDVASVDLDVTLAVPLGLIINEAVTNSLKYGFPNHQRGTIYIELGEESTHTYRLIISDNGIGLPADLNPNRSRTLGLSLIRGLSKQLGAGLQITSVNGVQLSLLFTEERMAREEPVRT